MAATRKKSAPSVPKFKDLAISGCTIQMGPSTVEANQAAVEAMKALTAVAEAVKEWARYAPVVVKVDGSAINIGDTK